MRLTSQPSLGGRTSKRKGLGGTAVATGTTSYGTNELVGRKIWCVCSHPSVVAVQEFVSGCNKLCIGGLWT